MVAILNPKWPPKYKNPPIWKKFGFQVDYDVAIWYPSLVCYGGHFESILAAKLQKSSNLGELWLPSKLWCCELTSIVLFAMAAILNPKWPPNYKNSSIWATFGFQVDFALANWYLSSFLELGAILWSFSSYHFLLNFQWYLCVSLLCIYFWI